MNTPPTIDVPSEVLPPKALRPLPWRAIYAPAAIVLILYPILYLRQSPFLGDAGFWMTLLMALISGATIIAGLRLMPTGLTVIVNSAKLLNLILLFGLLEFKGLASWVAGLGIVWNLTWILACEFRGPTAENGPPLGNAYKLD
jgi:hypothetical protein